MFNQIPVFTPADHYWAKTDGTLFSSKRAVAVAPNDPQYQAWAATGLLATPYPVDTEGRESEAELQAVLDPYGLDASLAHYAGARRFAIETAGITLPDGTFVSTTRESQAQITNAWADITLLDLDSISFTTAAGAVTMPAADVIAMAKAVGAHRQACRTAEAAALAAITAGKAKTKADVDALFLGLSA